MRWLRLVVVLLPLLGGTAVRAQTGIFVPQMAAVDSIVAGFMDRWDLPGGAVAISRWGRLVYARGFGDAVHETGEPVVPASRFRVASISKTLTAVTVLWLCEEGRLDLERRVFGPAGILDDPLYAEVADPRALDITVRHLLQHTAGWDRTEGGDPLFDPVGVAGAMGTVPPADQAAIIRYALARSLDFAPGTRFAYSNLGFCVLGRVIEAVTGMSYPEAVRRYVLEPLGLATFAPAGNLLADRGPDEVEYYDHPGAPWRPSFHGDGTFAPAPYGTFNIEAMDAAGGWVASAPDLVRLLAAVDMHPSRPDILAPDTILAMITPALRGGAYGLGWSRQPHQWWWGHSGSLPGASGIFYKAQAGILYAFLFSSQPEDYDGYWADFGRMIEDALASVTTWPDHDLFDSLVAVGGGTVPGALGLAQNFPNPFNPSTTISYDLPRAAHVVLRILDLRGSQVRTLVDGRQPAGPQAVIWNGRDDRGSEVASGIYLYTLQADELTSSRKMLLVR